MLGALGTRGKPLRIVPMFVAGIVFCSLAAGTLPARADDDDAKPEGPRSYPYLKGEIEIKFQHDNVFNADDPDAELTDTFNKTEAEIEAHFNRYFSLHGAFVFEPVLDPGPGDDRFFDDEGLFIEQLYGQIDLAPVSIFAGKFNPAFGKAWDTWRSSRSGWPSR